MPVRSPPKPCPVCRKLGCPIEGHRRKAWQGSTPTRVRRPGFAADRKRREAVVKAWRAQYGSFCPRCRRTGVSLTADHLHPIALGGAEDGPLGVLCVHCQRQQGARVARAKQRAAAPTTHRMKPTPPPPPEPETEPPGIA